MLSLDANFRLKCKERGIKDVRLGGGYAYLVEEEQFKSHLSVSSHAVEVHMFHNSMPKPDKFYFQMNTCGSNLKAIDHVNTHFSDGYAATGVGAVVCAQHTLLRKNGVCDLQKGEHYVNMDYILASTLVGVNLFHLLIVYDIACQWLKKLRHRMSDLRSNIDIDLNQVEITVAIPKGHIKAHSKQCQSTFSLNYLPGSARTDGKGVE